MRLIDKDALMEILGITDMDCDKCAWVDKEWNRCKRGGDFEDACCAIENAPTIEERKKGQWLFPYGDKKYKRCSECGKVFYSIPHNTKYCPECGTDMRGDDNG